MISTEHIGSIPRPREPVAAAGAGATALARMCVPVADAPPAATRLEWNG